ncbi:hypothetical protein [Pontibacter roseus]|uniref:hypothetical protein n=1 Tax=Pontibacter roseus TaxID=336989 RepID=UPI00035E35E9|nr:hypothetical protein [Pontibacter roseus]
MGKRQIRIFRTDIPQRLPELLLQGEVQVILRSRVVVQGVLKEASAEELELQDGRRSRHRIPLQEVEEVIYDIEAPY